MTTGSSSTARKLVAGLFLVGFLLAFSETGLRALWPSIVALASVLLLRRVFTGLLIGAASGALILAEGNPLAAFTALFGEHLVEGLQSSWKIGPILFTFILGGFAALIEKGGGLRSAMDVIFQRTKNPREGLQWAAFGTGLVCFFDGLANSLTVGRVYRGLADLVRLPRVALAYIVDSTSSAVACVAIVSSWIAFQLERIQEGLNNAGFSGEVNVYGLFLQSIPLNYYCLFTIILLPIVFVRRAWFGPMRTYFKASSAHEVDVLPEISGSSSSPPPGRAHTAVIPLVVLLFSLLGGMYLDGIPGSGGSLIPANFEAFADAIGQSGNSGAALVLVYASIIAAASAYALYPAGTGASGREPASQVFMEGVQSMFSPILVLLGAWMLSSTLDSLGAGDVVAGMLGDWLPLFMLPTLIFVVSAATSFSTGTSWGTMGIVMPIAVSVTFAMAGPEAGMLPEGSLLVAPIAAVFSGAVFGDHCSPLSDTTIVSSIACEIEPHDHVKTQLPYALLAGSVAIVVGFIPAGLGVPSAISLPLGILVLWFIAGLLRNNHSDKKAPDPGA